MAWWKKALIASAALFAIIAAAAVFMIKYVMENAESTRHAEAWVSKLGQVTGFVAGLGLGAIWFSFWKFGRKG